jgi:hypothetical protein
MTGQHPSEDNKPSLPRQRKGKKMVVILNLEVHRGPRQPDQSQTVTTTVPTILHGQFQRPQLGQIYHLVETRGKPDEG